MGPCCILKTIKNVKGIQSDLKIVRNLGFKLCGWFNVLSHHQSQDWVKCHLERFINFSVNFHIYSTLRIYRMCKINFTVWLDFIKKNSGYSTLRIFPELDFERMDSLSLGV